MNRVLRFAGFMARLCLGAGIIAYLLYRIDTHTSCIDFTLANPATVPGGTTYADSSDATRLFVVLEPVNGGNLLKTVQRKGTAHLTETGTLAPVSGTGNPGLQWTSWRASRSGLRFLWDIIRGTLGHWPWMVSGLLLFFLAFGIITVRWKLILDTQRLPMAWTRVFSISFVGVFFNSFMPGALGGDLVRGYYTSRESEHRKTELFLTVFIDRMLGLPSILLLPLAAMATRPGLSFSNPITRTVFLLLILALFTFSGLILLFFKHDLFERFGFLRRLEKKASLGAIIRRGYDAIRVCLTHPSLVAKGLALSALGQTIGVVAGFCFAHALGVTTPFFTFLSLYLVAMFISGIPVTPGGLGLREAAMVLLLSAADIPAVTSVALSLLVYMGTLACGALGALVFICFSGPQGRAPAGAAQGPSRP